MRLSFSALLLPAVLGAVTISGCKPSGSSSGSTATGTDLKSARAGFTTHLIKEESGEDGAPEKPPEGVFDLVHFTSPAGSLAAYVSTAPTDGKKHPLIIWLTGGFSNSISSISWEEGVTRDNDQSAAAYRHAGIAMMYPSLRGGNDNPGKREGLYGEVDDVLAAADYAAKLPWVDPQRIYLGGHSTGGTLALLTAEAAADTRFRAVIAFGPVESVSLYGQDVLPYEVRNVKETRLRAPMNYLSSIQSPTLVIEGDGERGNSDSLATLQRLNSNSLLRFTLAKGHSHFSVLAPANAILAEKLLKDTGPTPNLSVSQNEIDAASEKLMSSNFIPAGDVRGPFAQAGVVFYHSAGTGKLTAEIRKTLAADPALKDLPIYASFSEAKEPPFAVLEEEKAPFKEFELPDQESFRYVSRGMSAADVTAIHKSTTATSFCVVVDSAKAFAVMKNLNTRAAGWAEGAKAFLWDGPTRECFTRESWKETRIDGWGGEEIPDLRSQINMHAYQAEEGKPEVRIITLGMAKFGLPDIVIPKASQSRSSDGGRLINLVGQTLACQPLVKDPEKFAVDIAKLQPASAVPDYRKMLVGKGTGTAVLSLTASQPDEGDEDNTQIALDFRLGAGTTLAEKYSSLMDGLWGTEDKAFTVKQDAAIEKASAEARERLKKLAPEFSKGIPENTRLMVKAPFRNPGENDREFMWVEVQSWEKGKPIKGLLQNDPSWVKNLRRGSKVEIDPAEVFDYSLIRADGSSEGGEAEALLEKE